MTRSSPRSAPPASGRAGQADGRRPARRRDHLPGRRHRRPADEAAQGRPAARRAAVLQLPGGAPTYEVVELLVGAGLAAKLAAGVADTLGPDAARRLRDDPWALLVARRHARRRPAGDRRPQGRRPAGHPARPGDRRPHAADGDPRRAHRAARRPRRGGAAGRGHQRPGGRRRGRGRVGRRAGARAAGAGGSGRRAGSGAAHAVAGPLRDGRGAGREAIARLTATAERIADPASVRSVAKGLDKAQAEAVAQVLGAGVSLLTGGPGTARARWPRSSSCWAKGTDIALAAPTGRRRSGWRS